jgi:hypothetical protein
MGREEDGPDEIAIIPWEGALGVAYRRGSRRTAHALGQSDWPTVDRFARAGTLDMRGGKELLTMFQVALARWRAAQ